MRHLRNKKRSFIELGSNTSVKLRWNDVASLNPSQSDYAMCVCVYHAACILASIPVMIGKTAISPNSPNFHTKRSSHDASGSKLGIVWPSIFQRNWGGPLLGVQGQCSTAPKMRFCSFFFLRVWENEILQWPFLPKLAQLWQTAVLLQVQKALQCPTATTINHC